MYGEKFRSVVINRRGHTPHQKLQAPRFNLFGDVDDLEQVYWHIQQQWAAPHTPFFLHGISSGTSVVVSALAEYDRRRYYLEQQPLRYFDRMLLPHLVYSARRLAKFCNVPSFQP